MSQTKAELVNGLSVNAAAADAITVDSAGKIGIGETSPSYSTELKVSDTTAYSASTTNSTQHQLRINNAGLGGVAGILLTAEPSSGSAGHAGIRVISPSSGKANMTFSVRDAGTYSEKLRIQNDGNVSIGTNVPEVDATHHILTIAGKSSNGAGGVSFVDTSANVDGFIFADTGSLFLNADYDNATASSSIRFRVDGSSEKMRITDAGQIQIGTTISGGAGGVTIIPNNSQGAASILFDRANTSGTSTVLNFENNNTTVGSISHGNSSTAYNTSSDYRLKENATAISDGITRLKTLKPYRFNFIIDADKTVDGFFAHEVTAVPEAITGTKDEIVTQSHVDSGEYQESELGNPIYQGIDQSKLVPLLVAAVKELITKVETLEAA